jgi:hypothetical protein
MKVSTFYMADISEYNNFIEKLYNDIQKKFVGKGINSILISRFISYLRKEFSIYASFKLNKKTNIIIIIPRISTNLIEKTIHNNIEQIKIRVEYNKLKEILSGQCENLEDYINELVEQFKEYVNDKPSLNFSKYLYLQIDNLVDICYNELISIYQPKIIYENLMKNKGWIILSRKSSIFNDYYNLFQQNKIENKNIFHNFLYKLALKLKD